MYKILLLLSITNQYPVDLLQFAFTNSWCAFVCGRHHSINLLMSYQLCKFVEILQTTATRTKNEAQQRHTPYTLDFPLTHTHKQFETLKLPTLTSRLCSHHLHSLDQALSQTHTHTHTHTLSHMPPSTGCALSTKYTTVSLICKSRAINYTLNSRRRFVVHFRVRAKWINNSSDEPTQDESAKLSGESKWVEPIVFAFYFVSDCVFGTAAEKFRKTRCHVIECSNELNTF